MFAKWIVFILIFICVASRTSTRFYFIFRSVSVSVSGYPFQKSILYYVFVYNYYKNSFGKQNRCQNRDFSYPDRILVGIRDFQAKSGRSRHSQNGWTVSICSNFFLFLQKVFSKIRINLLAICQDSCRVVPNFYVRVLGC